MTELEIASVAADAKVDPRTVKRALVGKTRSLITRMAVAQALRRAGFRREAVGVEKARGRSKRKVAK